MERSRGMKKGAAAAVKAMFLAAALVSTGCTGNTLMGPGTHTTDTQATQTGINPAGNNLHPAGNNVRP
jgi:predicted small secreted protein